MNDSPIPPPGRALASLSGSKVPGRYVKRFQRAAGALHVALRVGQRFLPPPYDNIASTVSKLLTPPLQAPPPAPPVNLTPLEDSLTDLHAQHRNLRDQVREQNASLKRVGDQLEMVNEAADRNALAQQQLLEEMKAVGARVEELKAAGRKANLHAQVALGLLALSIALNVILLLYLRHILS